MTQMMRQSQFIITWGPGSILEGPNGPRIIPMPDIGLFGKYSKYKPEDFEISDERMSKGLLNGKRIFRLPSNVELGKDDSSYIYRTKPFPEWKICTKDWILFKPYPELCCCPKCKNKEVDAIRFVMACPEGHLDDVDWNFLVHYKTGGICKKGKSYPKYYLWRGEGGPLKDIEIECPECGAKTNMGYLYRKKWKCSGRSPEKEDIFSGIPVRKKCSSDAIVIQRQASNLRIPEISSLFTVDLYTNLHRCLSSREMRTMLLYAKPSNKNELEKELEKMKEQQIIKPGTVEEILSHPWDEIKMVINDIESSGSDEIKGYGNLILDEFRKLIHGSVNGVPPLRRQHRFSDIIFEIPASGIRKVSGPGGNLFRVVPVTKLRTVIVQRGFRRSVSVRRDINKQESLGKLVPVSFVDRNTSDEWYPGAEFIGEGIFIVMDNESFSEYHNVGKNWDKWKHIYEKPPKYPDHIFRDPMIKNEFHPLFVWWHTFSHLLLRVLSIDSGYSSASIRERIYFEQNGTAARGGIIIYTVQPGEGTLGGLVSLVKKFETILKRVVELSESCPNDPLCFQQTCEHNKITGAACHGCLFLSETSCEHRNMWLDRHLIMEMKP